MVLEEWSFRIHLLVAFRITFMPVYYTGTNLLYLPSVYLCLAIPKNYIILPLSGKRAASPTSSAYTGCATSH